MTSVLLVRPDHNEADAAALAAAGFDVVTEPWLEIRPAADAAPARALAERLDHADERTWLAVTSPRTWPSWEALVPDLGARLAVAETAGLRVAAVGPASARTVPAATEVAVPQTHDAEHLAALLAREPGGTLLLPASAIARPTLPGHLAGLGWRVHQAAVYETVPVAARPVHADAVAAGEIDAVVLRSPSAARALALFAAVPRDMMVVAVGPTTAAAASTLGGRLSEIPVVDAAGLAEKMETLW